MDESSDDEDWGPAAVKPRAKPAEAKKPKPTQGSSKPKAPAKKSVKPKESDSSEEEAGAKVKPCAKAKKPKPKQGISKGTAKKSTKPVDDSSDDDDAVQTLVQAQAAKKEAENATHESRKKKPFSTARVINTVLGSRAAGVDVTRTGGVMGKMGPFFKTDTIADWLNWAETTADHIEEVPKDQRKTSFFS